MNKKRGILVSLVAVLVVTMLIIHLSLGVMAGASYSIPALASALIGVTLLVAAAVIYFKASKQQHQKSYYNIVRFLGDIVLELNLETACIKIVNDNYKEKINGEPLADWVKKYADKMTGKYADIYKNGLTIENIQKAINAGGSSFIFMGIDAENEHSTCWYKCEIRPISDNKKKAYIIFENIEQEKRFQQNVIKNAEQDSLTGVLCPTVFEQKVDHTISTLTEKQKVAFAIIDIDNFTNINKEHGFPNADKLLKAFAAQLKERFPSPAIIGRIGGDEFAVLSCTFDSVNKLTKAITKACSNFTSPISSVQNFSASAGICVFPTDGENFQTLFNHADIALYQAKSCGKSQAYIFDTLKATINPHATLERMRERGEKASMPVRFEEYSFLEFIFATLYKQEDIAPAMTSVLEFMVRYLAISCAYVLTPSPFTGLYDVTYEWSRNGCEPATRALQGISCNSAADLNMRLLQNGIFYTQEFSILPPRMKEIFKANGATGVALIPLTDNSENITGMLILEARSSKSVIGREEMRGLRLAGRAISSFLNQQQSQKSLNENFAITKTIIDTVPTEIYVVDKGNYSLLFYNNEATGGCEGVCVGEKCYTAFYKRTSPCEDCPIANIPKGKAEAVSSFYNPVLNRNVRMMATKTRWKNRSDAYLLTGYDKMETSEEKEQQRKDRRYRLALRDIYEYICEIDLHSGFFQIFNRNADSHLILPNKGLFETEILKMATNLLVAEDAKKLVELLTIENLKTLKRLENKEITVDFRVKGLNESSYIWCNASAVLAPGENGSTDNILMFIKQIDEEKRVEELEFSNQILKQQLEHREQLQLRDRRYKLILKQTGAIVFEHTDNEQFVSEKVFELLNFSKNQYIAEAQDLLKTILKYSIHPSDKKDFVQFIDHAENGDASCDITARLLTASSTYRYFKISVANSEDVVSLRKRFLGTILDVHAETEAFRTLKYRAEFDPLTGIYNYFQFCSLAKNIIDNNLDKKYVIMALDIDKFKLINDIHGIAIGDEALRHIGVVLSKSMTAGNICGRIHSDVFCILQEYENSNEIIELTKIISNKIKSLSITLQLSAFFGIYCIDDRKTPISLMVDRAHLAKRSVKGSVVQNYKFYEDDLRINLVEEKGIENDMYRGLENNEFVVYYQPKVQLSNSSICGVEALVRWNHPSKGFLPPASFIPVFERNGFISKLDIYVWEQACKTLSRWKKEKMPIVPISVNVSRVHINNPNFVQDMLELVGKYDIQPNLLHLEITESLFFENDSKMYALMDNLQKAGFLLEMDDFGSGYSSLNMLRTVPINTIKIDKAFLDDTLSTDRGQVVVRHTVSMAKELSLKVIAEGVETQEQMAFLREINCDDIQGFYIAKPMPVEQFEKMLIEYCG